MRRLAALLTLLAGSAAAGTGDFVADRLALPPITLTDQHGASHALRELMAGGVVVMNFGYTTCESICPLGNAVMAQLDDDPRAASLRLISITIDPAQDTPARMDAAARSFDASERWLWLTAAPGDIRSLLRSLDADVTQLALHDPLFVVADADGRRLYRSVTLPTAEELRQLAEDIAR